MGLHGGGTGFPLHGRIVALAILFGHVLASFGYSVDCVHVLPSFFALPFPQ
jgi:hypothetical protein